MTAEGKKEAELFDKFMCYCKTGADDLAASISAADSKLTADTSSLEAAVAMKSQLEKDLEAHKTGREEAQASVNEAVAIREKEAAEFAKAAMPGATSAKLGGLVGHGWRWD